MFANKLGIHKIRVWTNPDNEREQLTIGMTTPSAMGEALTMVYYDSGDKPPCAMILEVNAENPASVDRTVQVMIINLLLFGNNGHYKPSFLSEG